MIINNYYASYLAGSKYLHVLWCICFIIIVFRLMCTVSAFFSVKCASRNYQILKDVINKSQWSQTACFEPLYGDVCNENLQPDQIWKRLSRNLKTQFNSMSLLYCYVQTTCMCDYSSPVCINGTRFCQHLTQC